MAGSAHSEVSLADADRAAQIARLAAQGSGSDRAPTLEHLLLAFDEPDPTPEARERIAAALRMAGVAMRPHARRARRVPGG
jgi:hypothetical protein